MDRYTIRLTDDTEVLVDPDIHARLADYTWYALSDGNAARIRPRTGKGARRANQTKRVLLHREIMNEPAGLHVGFINGDPKDCRRQNLFTYAPGQKNVVLREIFSRESNQRAYESGAPTRSLPLEEGGECLVDVEDYERFCHYTWHKADGFVRTVLADGQKIALHRELMGNPKGMYVSFLDGDRLDCRKKNLFAFRPGKKKQAWEEHMQKRIKAGR